VNYINDAQIHARLCRRVRLMTRQCTSWQSAGGRVHL
jgi:hypothetical protein